MESPPPPAAPKKSWKAFALGGCLGVVLGAALLLTALLVAYGFYQKQAVKKMAEVKELQPVQLRASYDWPLTSVEGTAFDLNALKGKPVFLHLWRPSCVSCVAEIPGINALYEALASRGVAFVSVALEDGAELLPALQLHAVSFPVYTSKENSVPAGFDAHSTPATYIINTDGYIVYEHQGAVEWNTPDAIAFLESLVP